MSLDLRIEDVLIQVRSRLNDEKVKLWLPPYYDETIGTIETELENLAKRYSSVLGLHEDYCFAAINELQNTALDKLQARKEFQETGVATIKVRVSGITGGSRIVTVKQKLTDLGSELKKTIGNQLNISSSQLKLICSGRMIKDDLTLNDQQVSNNHQIMVLVLPKPPGDIVNNDVMYENLRTAREDAETLMSSSNSMFKMEDQSGNAVHLPPAVRKHLIMALALHEKGKSALNKDQYSEALIFFLEADSEFSQCDKQWLNAVDNYAILNLDIVWCYLCLKSVMQLPDAERRLNVCEESFKKTYGENMNRLMALKGSSQNEKVLLMRLHLLNAVLMFHRNQRHDASAMLSVAESELNQLTVNDESLCSLVEMGYTETEARTGLRSCSNDISEAINFILKRREERDIARKRAREEYALENLIQKTDEDGKGSSCWINPRNLATLAEMGFPKLLCTIALKKANDDVEVAIQMLQENREELTKLVQVSRGNVDELIKMGYPKSVAEHMLKISFDDLNETIENLLKLEKEGVNITELVPLGILNQPGTSGLQSDPVIKTGNQQISEEEKKRRDAAYDRYAEDLNQEDDKYLDFNLVQERNILTEYKKYLN